jgi:selenocysteine-specific elongation factor
MVDEAGAAGLPVASLVTRVGVNPGQVDARIAALRTSGGAMRAGAVLVSPAIVADARARVVAALGEHHRAQPLSEGIPREELRELVFARGHADIFELALADLTAAGSIAARDRVALATHRVALSPEETRARDVIERAYREAALTPPDPASLAADTGIQAATIDRIVKLLQRQKVLVRVDTLVFHDEALKRLKAEVAALKTSAGANARLDVAMFKERFGVTRKFAIPLLEYLDRERVTRRMGDARVVL